MSLHTYNRRRWQSVRPATWGLGWWAATLSLGVILGCAMYTELQAQPSIDQVKAAQRMLGALGYDLGAADGKIGPKTRRAIEAFQLTYNLPVTRELDRLTLNALGLAPKAAEPEVQPSPPLSPSLPWSVVLAYLRYYDTQPARLLQYVTEGFRQGLSSQEWIRRTSESLAKQRFSRLSWQIERVEEGPPSSQGEATVYVNSRVRISGEELMRHEVFQVVQASESEWLISDWSSRVISTSEQEAISRQ